MSTHWIISRWINCRCHREEANFFYFKPVQKYKFAWNRFSEIKYEIQNDQITFKRYTYQTFTGFDDSLSKRGLEIFVWFWVRFQRTDFQVLSQNDPESNKLYGKDLITCRYWRKDQRETYLDWFHDRLLLDTLIITDLPYPGFNPFGQNQPENLPAFPEKSSGEHVLNSHDRTMTDPTTCELHTQQWIPRHVVPMRIKCGPYL